VTDETGGVVERFSFDAFGKRRQANWLAMSDVTLFASVTTTRGFTGHEMVDPVGLVHMNGRVYDPELGRFISADPIVQDLSNLQSWNRYSYVLNNPLSMTDP
jgi:RHS repeat-associated protein